MLILAPAGVRHLWGERLNNESETGFSRRASRTGHALCVAADYHGCDPRRDPRVPRRNPNRFKKRLKLATASFRTVVRPNVDTIYSTAWLDLSVQPVVLTVPPSNGRYFM